LVARAGSQIEYIPLTQLYCRDCIRPEPRRWDLPERFQEVDEEDEPDWREAQITAELLFEREPSLYRTVQLWLEAKSFPVPKRHEFHLDWRSA